MMIDVWWEKARKTRSPPHGKGKITRYGIPRDQHHSKPEGRPRQKQKAKFSLAAAIRTGVMSEFAHEQILRGKSYV